MSRRNIGLIDEGAEGLINAGMEGLIDAGLELRKGKIKQIKSQFVKIMPNLPFFFAKLLFSAFLID